MFETITRPSRNAVDLEMRSRPLKSVLETKTNQEYYNTELSCVPIPYFIKFPSQTFDIYFCVVISKLGAAYKGLFCTFRSVLLQDK